MCAIKLQYATTRKLVIIHTIKCRQHTLSNSMINLSLKLYNNQNMIKYLVNHIC